MKKRYMLLMIAAFLVSGYIAFETTHNNSASAQTNVSFAQDVQPILKSRCATCHMGKAASGGLSMNSYESLMAGSDDGAVIVAGHAGQSYLVENITSGDMPKRGPKLTPGQIQMIVDWINAGALNN